jgi:secondary thiamine-phosphate synthase enzyme
VYIIQLRTEGGVALTDVTPQVAQVVADSGIGEGLCYLFVPHSTAAVTINSAIDGETPADLAHDLNRIVPMRTDFVHQYDSPQDAAGHIKASLIGVSVTIPIDGGRLALGSTQSILFCEFDGPRQRKLYVSLVPLPTPGGSEAREGGMRD